jgi:hypothetical protein
MPKDMEVSNIKALCAFNGVRNKEKQKDKVKPKEKITEQVIAYGDCSHPNKIDPKKVKKILQFNSKKEESAISKVYSSKIVIMEANKKYSLWHHFDDRAHLKQMKIHYPKLLYALYECNSKQIITAWHYHKSYCLMTVDTSLMNRFDICPISPSLISCASCNRVYSIQFNFTNKNFKEIPTNIEMKLEKSNDFIDIGYIPKTDWWVVITQSNNVFFMNKMQCAFQIVNFSVNPLSTSPSKREQIDSADSDSDDSVDIDALQKNPNSGLVQIMSETKAKTGISEEEISKINQTKSFTCLHVTSKEVYIGTTSGYLVAFEFDTTRNPIHKYTFKVGDDIYYIESITTNIENSMVGCAIVYPIRAPLKSQAENSNRFDKIYDFAHIARSQLEDQVHNALFTRLQNSAYSPERILDVRATVFKKEFYSISQNNSLTVWSLTDRWQQISRYFMDGKPISIDVHPSSMIIAVGFKKYLKLFSILSNKISLIASQEIPNLIKVKYCKGGSLLAVGTYLT